MYEDTPAGFAYRLDQSALLLRPYVPFYVFLGCCKTYAESVKFFLYLSAELPALRFQSMSVPSPFGSIIIFTLYSIHF
jgi:hypothetical protein